MNAAPLIPGRPRPRRGGDGGIRVRDVAQGALFGLLGLLVLPFLAMFVGALLAWLPSPVAAGIGSVLFVGAWVAVIAGLARSGARGHAVGVGLVAVLAIGLFAAAVADAFRAPPPGPVVVPAGVPAPAAPASSPR